MLNKDYNPYDQLEYLSNGFVELAGLLNRQTSLIERQGKQLARQHADIQELNMRLTNLEMQKWNLHRGNKG